MTGDVIKSFLVGLGFSVDDSSLAKFNKAIASATLKVAALYTSIKLSAAGIFYSISKISEGFEEMGYNLRLVAPAVNKMLLLRQAMLSAYRAAGIDLTKVVKQSILFNFSLAKTKFALEAVYKSVGAKFLPLLTKQMDIFRSKIFQNMPKIQEQLMKFVNFIFKAFEATVELGTRVWSILGRVWDFFKRLDEATDGWSTKILGLIAIWKILNLSFLATPLGMVLTGLLAILALYDDFKVWEEGGKSFFDWSAFVPVANALTAAFSALVTAWSAGLTLIKDYYKILYSLFTLDFSGFTKNVAAFGRDLLNVFGPAINYVKSLWQLLEAFVGWLPTAGAYLGKAFGFGGANVATNGIAQPQPLLPTATGVNQKVSQETNITVQGTADANATGRAVASEQGKVNFDMTRNMKGAVR